MLESESPQSSRWALDMKTISGFGKLRFPRRCDYCGETARRPYFIPCEEGHQHAHCLECYEKNYYHEGVML